MKLQVAVCVLIVADISSAFTGNGPPPSCCLGVNHKKIRLDSVVDYRWQNKELCPIIAVVFHTRAGNRLCSDPDMDWTKRAMRKVDMEKQRKQAESSKKDSTALTTVSPAEGNREGASPPTLTKLPVISRGLQESAVSAAPAEQQKTERPVKSIKAPQGSKRQRRKKGKSRKRQRKVKKSQ